MTPRLARLRALAKELVTFAVIAVVVSNVASYLRRPRPQADARPSLSAPPLSAPLARGEELRASALSDEALAGEPIVLYFWATWCGVCTLQSPVIDALSREGVKVISVAVSSGDSRAVRSFMDERGYSFPTLSDPHGEAQRRWGVSAFPTVFVYGAEGAARFSEVGYTSSLGLRARLWLAGF